MRILECSRNDEIFSHEQNGVLRLFNATALRKWALEHPAEVETFTVPIDPNYVQYVRVNCGVEEEHLPNITPEQLEIPLLAVHMPDGSTLTIDGHHRLVRRFDLGMKDHQVMRVPLGKWEWCVVDTNDPLVRLTLRTDRGIFFDSRKEWERKHGK